MSLISETHSDPQRILVILSVPKHASEKLRVCGSIIHTNILIMGEITQVNLTKPSIFLLLRKKPNYIQHLRVY